MGRKKFSFIALLALALFPMGASAILVLPDQPLGNQQIDILTIIDSLFAIVWPITVFVVIVTFIWAGILFLTAAGNQGQVESAKKAFIWGSVGVGVIVLAFSMILIIKAILGIA